MPVVGFKCPIHRTNVGFDHFETCDARGGRPAYSPWMARFIEEQVENDVRHAGLALTATRTSACPRMELLKAHWDYYVDPERGAAKVRGSALHKVADGYWPEHLYYTTKRDPVRMTLEGELFGRRISMEMDVLRKDLREIIDMKFPNDFSVKYRNRPPFVEYQIQLNIARLLLAQQDWAVAEGYDPNNVLLTVWDHAAGLSEGPRPKSCDHMTEDAMLDVMAYGGEFSVSEILEIWGWMVKEVEKAPSNRDHLEKVAASLPLVGEQQIRSKNGDTRCTSYCEVSDICAFLVRKYGRPEFAHDGDGAGDSMTEHELTEAIGS